MVSLTGQPGPCLPVLGPEEGRVSLPGMLLDPLVLVVRHSGTNKNYEFVSSKGPHCSGTKEQIVVFKNKHIEQFLPITWLGKRSVHR